MRCVGGHGKWQTIEQHEVGLARGRLPLLYRLVLGSVSSSSTACQTRETRTRALRPDAAGGAGGGSRGGRRTPPAPPRHAPPPGCRVARLQQCLARPVSVASGVWASRFRRVGCETLVAAYIKARPATRRPRPGDAAGAVL